MPPPLAQIGVRCFNGKRILEPTEQLAAAFRVGLALPAGFDVVSATPLTIGQWDSIGHLQLVAAIEKSFDLRLEPGDVIDLSSYVDAVAILKRLGAWPLV